MDFLQLNSAKDLFQYGEEIFCEYYKNPTLEKLIVLLFVLTHLREWITDGVDWNEIKKIPKEKRSAAQRFYEQINELSEYKEIVRVLFNGLKHCRIELKTEGIVGFTCGISQAGDFLSQKYILIEGKDSRTVFHTVLAEYRKWFNEGK